MLAKDKLTHKEVDTQHAIYVKGCYKAKPRSMLVLIIQSSGGLAVEARQAVKVSKRYCHAVEYSFLLYANSSPKLRNQARCVVDQRRDKIVLPRILSLRLKAADLVHETLWGMFRTPAVPGIDPARQKLCTASDTLGKLLTFDPVTATRRCGEIVKSTFWHFNKATKQQRALRGKKDNGERGRALSQS